MNNFCLHLKCTVMYCNVEIVRGAISNGILIYKNMYPPHFPERKVCLVQPYEKVL